MTSPLHIAPPPKTLGSAELDRWVTKLTQIVNALGTQWSCELVTEPATGFSYQIADEQGLLLLTPVAVLAAGTVILPKRVADGFEQKIVSSHQVASLTITSAPGQTIVGSTTINLHAGAVASFRWQAATLTWYQMLPG